MVMMTAGFNIEWSTFMASMLIGSIGIQWYAGIWHIKSLHRRCRYPYVPGYLQPTAMISAVKISHFGYSEPQMILLLSNFQRHPPLLERSPSGCRSPVCGFVPQTSTRLRVELFRCRGDNLAIPPGAERRSLRQHRFTILSIAHYL
jgi:hypothetical protein